jgi:hypothetical protein
MDTTERDHIRVGLLRRLRELQRVADHVGDVLDLAVLVVVREEDGVALTLEPSDLGFEVEGRIDQRVDSGGERLCHGSPAT